MDLVDKRRVRVYVYRIILLFDFLSIFCSILELAPEDFLEEKSMQLLFPNFYPSDKVNEIICGIILFLFQTLQSYAKQTYESRLCFKRLWRWRTSPAPSCA